jgi:hypothetical protein
MFKRGFLVEPRPLHKDWEKKTRFGQFDLSLPFFFYIYNNWSYMSNLEMILVGMETRLPYLSNGIWHAF